MTEPPDLWAKARERLPDDVREWLSGLDGGAQQSPTDAQWIDSLIDQAQKKQEELERSRHSFTLKAGRHKLELRPLFVNMIEWINKFKGIGHVVSSFDPVHAALPWAAFRFVLQHLVAEQEHSDKFVKLLASMPRLLFTGRLFELVYTRTSMYLEDTQDEVPMGPQSLENLHRELVNLYAGLLSALQFCHLFVAKNKAMRKIAAVFNSSKPGEILGQMEEQHKKAIAYGDDCKNISSHRFEQRLLRLLKDYHISLEEMKDQVSRILMHIDKNKRQETLRRISTIPFQTHHDSVSLRRTAGTCDWITRKWEYRRWTMGSFPVIVLYGITGAGKSFLTSKVIDSVIDSIKKSAAHDEAIAFFYCKRDEENRRRPQDILQSILRQLSSDLISDECKIHPSLEGLPDRLEREGKTLDFFTCRKLIKKIVKDYSRTTIILDALDECSRESREDLMKTFKELTQGNANVRIFLSSRADDDIRRHFESQLSIEIEARDNEEDISAFVQDRLSQTGQWDGMDPSLRHEIKQAFLEKSQGMFQWAALQIQQLNNLRILSRANILKHLEYAPQGLEAVYDVIWKQIQRSPPGEAAMAKRAFLWVLCAFEPLYTAELSLAMQLDPNLNEARPDIELSEENILDICGNLLTCVHGAKEGGDIWRFCHLSAREYVGNKAQYGIVKAHHHVAISSLKFLMRNTDWSLPPLPPSQQLEWILEGRQREADSRTGPPWARRRWVRLRPYYMLHQALNHAQYVDSLRVADTELGRVLKKFFGSIERGSSTFLKWLNECDDEEDARFRWTFSEAPRRQSRPLETMTAFGLFYMLQDWWQRAVDDPDIQRYESPSILSLAIKHGHEQIWRFLTNSKQAIHRGYPPPLMAAIEVNSMPALKALIDAGAEVNRVHRYLQEHGSEFSKTLGIDTPLKAAICAASYGFDGNWPSMSLPTYPGAFNGENEGYKLVRELLANKALVEMQTEHGSALELAAKHLTTEDAFILLDELQSVSSPELLFCWAAGNKSANLDCFFERLGVDVDCQWEGTSPLVRALEAGNVQGAQTLLRLGATLHLASKKDQEAVCRGAYEVEFYDDGRLEEFATGVLDFLLASDFDINATDGRSDLLSTFISLRPEDIEATQQLIYAGANVNQILSGSPFVTALALAAAQGNSELCEVLLEAGADPALNTNVGVGSALGSAAFFGAADICRMLLNDKGVDVNSVQGGFFSNALFALCAGHANCPTVHIEDTDSSLLDIYDSGMSDTDISDTDMSDMDMPDSPGVFIDCSHRPSHLNLDMSDSPGVGIYGFSNRNHLEVLQIFFENGLHLYMPLHKTLGPQSSSRVIDLAGYDVTETFMSWKGGRSTYLPNVWFSIAWELRNIARQQIPIRTSLRRWNFPKSLPPRFMFVAKLTPISRGLSTGLFVVLRVDQSSSEIRIAPTRRNNRQQPNIQTNEIRWRRYVPHDGGVVVQGLPCQVQPQLMDRRWASFFGNDQCQVMIYISVIAVMFSLFLWNLCFVA